MNIKYGDSNILVRYLQAFLQEYYNRSIRVSEIYDEYTHRNLIEYLSLPNVQDITKVYNDMLDKFPDIRYYFVTYRNVTDITLVSKYTGEAVESYMDSIKSDLEQFAYDNGWKVSEFTNYKNSETDKYRIVVTSGNRVNRFPNKELLCMVNMFMNKYLYDYVINVTGSTGYVYPNVRNSDSDPYYKLAIVGNCEPNTEYTICHAYSGIVNMTIGSSSYGSDNDFTVNSNLDNVEKIYLDSGAIHTYKTSDTCKSIVIQLQYTSNLSSGYSINVPIKRGDINLDGKIDSADLELLTAYVNYLTDPDKYDKVELSDQQYYAAHIVTDIGSEPNVYDIVELKRYLNGETMSTGLITYNNRIPGYSSTENVIMVSRGKFEDTKNHKANEYFPAIEYSKDQWMVHDKLLNYILDMSITPYSSDEDIKYIQDMMISIYPDSGYGPEGTYSEDLKNIVQYYQKSYGIPFHTGYVDVETEASILMSYNNGVTLDSETDGSIYIATEDGYYLSIDGGEGCLLVRR